MTRIRLLTIGAALALLTPVAACGRHTQTKGEERASADSLQRVLPHGVMELTESVREGDAKRFAANVSYPLIRPYPLRTINTEAEMKEYFPILVDNDFRKVITESRGEDWNEVGWRGWTLGNGSFVWVDEKIYDIPYLSHREHEERSKLIHRDTMSVHKDLRNGWEPVDCLRSLHRGKTYRIDHNPRSREREAYRLAIWNENDGLTGKPSKIFTGHRQSEGTANVVTYFFTSSDGSSAVYSPDQTEIDEPQRVVISSPDDKIDADTVVAFYWLDLFK